MDKLINDNLKILLSKRLENENDKTLDFEEKRIDREKIDKDIYVTLTGGFVLQNLILKQHKDNEVFWGTGSKEQISIKDDWSFLKKELFFLTFRPISNLDDGTQELILKIIDNHSRNLTFRNVNYYLQMLAQDTTKCLWSKNKSTSQQSITNDFKEAHAIVFKLYEKILDGLPKINDNLPSITKKYLEEVREFYALRQMKANLLKVLNLTEQQFVDLMKMGSYSYKEKNIKRGY